MTEHFDRFRNRFRQQIISIVVFATLFTVLGYFVPRFYFQYLDHTEYYHIDSPIEMPNSPYKSCNPSVPITLHRTALVDLYGKSVINLFLIREGNKNKVSEGTREMVISKGESDITTYWPIPCGIISGNYYYDGVVNYQLNGVDRQAFFSTETFVVTN